MIAKGLPESEFLDTIFSMPITRSAKKALRTSDTKREFNIARKNKVDRALKSIKKSIKEGSKSDAMKALRDVQKALDKAVKGNTLNKNTASRKKSRLSKMIKKLSK
ncbi:MAG: ribosomal protein small subunit ribosomal protein [Parcubacteria group bacterium]|nr:ribosomal protein small subunit ribosomal protein [Parcubacteria group bacterium]